VGPRIHGRDEERRRRRGRRRNPRIGSRAQSGPQSGFGEQRPHVVGRQGIERSPRIRRQRRLHLRPVGGVDPDDDRLQRATVAAVDREHRAGRGRGEAYSRQLAVLGQWGAAQHEVADVHEQRWLAADVIRSDERDRLRGRSGGDGQRRFTGQRNVEPSCDAMHGQRRLPKPGSAHARRATGGVAVVRTVGRSLAAGRRRNVDRSQTVSRCPAFAARWRTNTAKRCRIPRIRRRS
jgi:hypothetical protein